MNSTKIEEPVIIINTNEIELVIKYSDLVTFEKTKVTFVPDKSKDYYRYTLMYRDKYANLITIEIDKKLYTSLIDLYNEQPNNYVASKDSL